MAYRVIRQVLLFVILGTSGLPLLASELSSSQRQEWLTSVAEAVDAEDLASARERLAQYPDDPHHLSHSWRGRVSALDQDWRQAADHFAQALAQEPSYRPAAEGRIQALAMLEDWPGLRRMIGPWLAQADSPAAWWRAAAHAAWEDADTLMAEDTARRGLARYPDDLLLGRILALALGAIDSPGRSIAAWQRVVQHPQAEAEDWYHLSHNLDQAGRESQARRAMHIAYQLAPQHREVADSYLALLLDHGLAEDAYQLAQQLLSTSFIDQQHQRRLLLAARSAEAAGASAEAIAWLEGMSEAQRDRAWHLLYARSQASAGEPAAALAAINTLITQGSADSALRLWAAQLAWQGDDLPQAEAHLRAALASSSSDADADTAAQRRSRMQLIRLMIQQERHKEALQQLELLRATDPYDRDLRRLDHYLRTHTTTKEDTQP